MAKKRKNSRRANGEGSIVQRKDGRWCGVVTLGYKPDGKINRKSVYGHSQAEVLEKMSVLKHRLVTGPQVSSTTALVGETMKNWLLIFKKPMVSSRTFESNIRTFKNHILPAIGNMKINEVNTNIVQAILTKSLQDHKGRSNTPKRIKFLLNQFYEHLIEQGLAYDNPTLKCKVSNRYKKTYIDSKGQHKNNENYKAIPVAERARFIRALDDGPDIIKPLSLVMMLASLRIGEALALKWENVNFENKTLKVEQAITQIPKFDSEGNVINRVTVVGDTKTTCSVREIPIADIVVETLQRWREKQIERQKTNPDVTAILTSPTSFVFANDDGSYRTYSGTRKIFDRFKRRNGLNKFNIHFHGLRHTFSNMLFEMNENPKVIQQLLGHRDVKTTITVYNSVKSDYVREATDRLNNKIQEQQKEKEIEIDKTKEPELTDEEIDRMIRELKRKKKRKEKDFEM